MHTAGLIQISSFILTPTELTRSARRKNLDMDTYLSQGPLVIEWPERVEPILPAERLWAWLEYESEEHRTMRFAACGKRYENYLDHLRQVVYGGD